jgi:hypothetical protein
MCQQGQALYGWRALAGSHLPGKDYGQSQCRCYLQKPKYDSQQTVFSRSWWGNGPGSSRAANLSPVNEAGAGSASMDLLFAAIIHPYRSSSCFQVW